MTQEDYAKVESIIMHLKNARAEVDAGVFLLNELLGAADALNDVAAYRRTLFRIEAPNFRPKGDDLQEQTNKTPDVGTPGEEGDVGTPPTKTITTVLQFTKQEIEKTNMSKTFKKTFILNGLVARVTKRFSGKNSFCYEIRYRANGYYITASSTNLHEAKRKFLAKTVPGEIEKYLVKNQKSGQDLFSEIFDEWYTVKDGTITEKALKSYNTLFQNLPESLRMKPIKNIRVADLNRLMQATTPRKYEDLRSLFNGIFKYAVASGIIPNNPVALIQFQRAERKNRDSLSADEIFAFLERIEQAEYERIRQGAYLTYFFGLRPCEIEDEPPYRAGDFLIARNRKRKRGKVEYKKIPIPKEAEGLIDWKKPLDFCVSKKTREKLMKKLLDGKTTYNLRHTFSSICRQSVGVDVVEIWMGDSPERLVDRVYTHFPDEFMRENMARVNFPTLETLKNKD